MPFSKSASRTSKALEGLCRQGDGWILYRWSLSLIDGPLARATARPRAAPGPAGTGARSSGPSWPQVRTWIEWSANLRSFPYPLDTGLPAVVIAAEVAYRSKLRNMAVISKTKSYWLVLTAGLPLRASASRWSVSLPFNALSERWRTISMVSGMAAADTAVYIPNAFR